MSSDAIDGDVVVDAREIDQPFGEITSALGDLEEGECLVLINSFEPEPLYDVLERQGFTHETTRVGPDEWRVTVEHA